MVYDEEINTIHNYTITTTISDISMNQNNCLYRKIYFALLRGIIFKGHN